MTSEHARRWVGPAVVVAAAVAAVVLTSFASPTDLEQMWHPTAELLGGDWADLYQPDTGASSLVGWVLLVALPLAALRGLLGELWGFAAAGAVAVPLLVGGVRFALRRLFPAVSVASAWAVAGLAVVLPTTVAAWTQYFHPQDVAATGLVCLGLGLVARRRGWAAGAVFAAAVLTRQWSLLVAAPVLATLPWRTLVRSAAAAAGTLAIALVPLWLMGNPGLVDAFSAYNRLQVSDATVVGRWLAATGDVTTLAPYVRLLPTVMAVALTALVLVRRWRDASFLVPLAVTALCARLLVETVPYLYYWAPVVVLLLLAPRWRHRLVAVALSVALALTAVVVTPLTTPLVTVAVWLGASLVVPWYVWAARTDGASRLSAPDTSKQRPAPARGRFVVAGVVATIVVITSLAAAAAWVDRSSGPAGATVSRRMGWVNVSGEVVVDGDPLPKVTDAVPDLAVGKIMPSVAGLSPINDPVRTDPSTLSLVVVLSPWCAECYNVPGQLAADGYGPSTLLVVTGADPQRPNWPIGPWLLLYWPGQAVLVDDDAGTAATSLGADATKPVFVVVDASGRVTDRWAGSWDPARLHP